MTIVAPMLALINVALLCAMIITRIHYGGEFHAANLEGVPPCAAKAGDQLIIHMPCGGCPAGYESALAIFHERDGSTRDGCWHGQAQTDPTVLQFSIDVLYGGESCCYFAEKPRKPRIEQ